MTVVEDYTYWGCEKLTSVDYLPNVTRVGRQAFYECSSLTSVYLPEALTIGHMAFEYCSKLTSVTAPKVTDIGDRVFESCTSLTTVDLQVASIIGGYTFRLCTALETMKLGYPGAISWGTSVLQSVSASNIALYLDESRIPAGGSKVWNGYTWKSISKYE